MRSLEVSAMKNEREIKSEISALRDRLKTLSGFWIGEGAAAIYALDWVLGKHDAPPAKELGKTGGGYERIAANLTKLVEKSAAAGGPPKARLAIAKSKPKKR
jgi:hypothetical protein